MTIITYFKLYQYLRRKDSLKPWEAVECISEVREMAPEILSVLKEWADGDDAPDITINGVSFNQLVNEEGMKPIRAFLMLDWLYREPMKAMNYLASGRIRSVIQEPSKEERHKLEEIIQNLKSTNDNIIVPTIKNSDDECSKGEDILLEIDDLQAE